mgnify:CR=1 FL=1
MQLDVNLSGLKLKNPIITASGTFGYGPEYQKYGDLSLLGGMVVKGLSLKPRQGNPMPRIAETSCGMLNAIGLQNIGAEKFVQDKLPYLPWHSTPVIANLYAQHCSEFAELAAYLAKQQEIAALEVNISCPNVKQAGVQFGQDPVMASKVCRAVKDNAGSKPVIVKLSPNVSNIAYIAREVEQAGADCLSLINTLSAMAVDIYSRKPRVANIIAGLSGPAIKPVALRMVYQVCQSVDIPVIGIGGIVSADDVLEFILVGAHAVQIGSANFVSPDRSFRLVQELADKCAELEINDWADFRGKLNT